MIRWVGMPLNLESAVFRAVVVTIVPESETLGEEGWQDLKRVIQGLLRSRPESVKRLHIFLQAIQWLPVMRYGRPFTRLSREIRMRVLTHLQNNRILNIRVGFWGLRTLVMAGYYGRSEAAREIGYAASVQGWEPLR